MEPLSVTLPDDTAVHIEYGLSSFQHGWELFCRSCQNEVRSLLCLCCGFWGREWGEAGSYRKVCFTRNRSTLTWLRIRLIRRKLSLLNRVSRSGFFLCVFGWFGLLLLLLFWGFGFLVVVVVVCIVCFCCCWCFVLFFACLFASFLFRLLLFLV